MSVNWKAPTDTANKLNHKSRKVTKLTYNQLLMETSASRYDTLYYKECLPQMQSDPRVKLPLNHMSCPM